MRTIIVIAALGLTACAGSPTEPTHAPPQPVVLQTTSVPAPEPTPAPPQPLPPVPPAPSPSWHGEVGIAYGNVDLPGHFDMKVTGTVLQFANHGADIVTQNQDGLFAVIFRPTPASPIITITIQFDSPTHGSFRWEGPQQYAVGEVVLR